MTATAEMKGEDMMRRTIAVLAGLLMLAGLAMLPTTAGAQSPPENTVPPTVLPSSTVPPRRPTTTTSRPRPQDTRPPATSTTVAGNEVENTSSTTPADTRPGANPQPEVRGDVVSRPLPRTGNDIGGTAVFGGALTVLGIALALGARKRRNSFDGA